MSSSENRQERPGEDDKFLKLRISRDTALHAAREAVRDTTRLTRLFSILNDPGPLEKILDRGLSTLSELFMSDLVILFDPVGTGSFSPIVGIGVPESDLSRPFSYTENSYLKLLQGSVNVIRGDTSTDTNIDPLLVSLNARHVVGLPVQDNFGVRGVLILARTHPEQYNDSDIGLLHTMSYRIGRTLVEFQRGSQMEKVIQISHVINSFLDFSSIAKEAVSSFPGIVGCDAALLVSLNGVNKPECLQQTGLTTEIAEQLTERTEHLTATTKLSAGKPFLSDTLAHFLPRDLPELPEELTPRALLAIPVHDKGRIKGVLYGIRFVPVNCNNVAAQTGMLFAEQLSAALGNAHLYQTVQRELKERKRLEEEQRTWERQQQQIQKANSLNSMAGGIAHHFNNLLAVVIGNLELITDDSNFTQNTKETIAEALKGAMKAADVSRLMLTYIGQASGDKKIIDLTELCHQCLPLIQAAAPKDINLSIALPETKLLINGNSNQIQQVITNLVTNAWEACKTENDAEIRFSVKSCEAESIPNKQRVPIEWSPEQAEYACIEIQDNGAGISLEDWDKIFVPFFSSKSPNRGLGLAVALGVVKAHKGCIVLNATEQTRGSSFQVIFPVVQVSHSHAAAPADQTDREPAKTGKILLVDDDPIVLRVIASMLHALDFEVIETRSGLEAIDRFKIHHHDIAAVLCDISMPQMNGWETTAELKKINASIPVILTSGHDPSQLLGKKSFNTSGQLFLAKPYKLSALKNILSQATARRPENSDEN